MAHSIHKTFLPIYKLFQLFYLAPIALTNTSKTKKNLQKLFCLFVFVLWLLNVFYIVRQFWIDQQRSPSFTYITTIAIISIAYCLTIIESLVNYDRQIALLNSLAEVDGLLEMESDAFTDTQFHRKYLTKVYGSFMCVVLCQLIGAICRASVIDWNEYGFCLAKFGLCLRLQQIGFYVDMLYERLCQVNSLLVAIQYDRCSGRIMKYLYLTRTIYGKLWTICCEITQTFGWSLAIINIEFMFDIVNDAHMLYDHMQSTALTIGK